MDISMHKFIINGKISKLSPGFRFHPNDEELVFEYLAKKVFKQPMNFTLLEIESCNVDPWELLGERDREKYFFVKRKKRKQNERKTTSGYWEEYELEKEIKASDNSNINNHHQVKGIKKTLVFLLGKKPHGLITSWVMEEFHLVHSKSIRPSCTRQQDKLEKWIAVKIFEKIGGDDEEENMNDTLFSWSSSSSSSHSVNNESDGEEVIQSK